MARVRGLRTRGFRSIDDWIGLTFPADRPVVLVGENNSGKSNVMRAIDHVLGERWRGNYAPEDHEFFGRNPEGREICIVADVEGVEATRYGHRRSVENIRWRHSDGDTTYDAVLDDGTTCYMSNAIKDQLLCVQMGADRRIRYELSYTNQYTLLAKIMRRFHQHLVDDDDRVSALKDHFSDIVSLFRGVDAFNAFEQTLRSEIGSLASNLRYPLDIDFSAYDPSNYFHALQIRPRDAEGTRTFDELGTGQEQLLAMSLLYAYAEAFGQQGAGVLLLLEEPESHLHPLAQRWLARRIQDYADVGIQVLITTHSPAFLSLLDVEGLVLVKKDPETLSTKTEQLTAEALRDACVALGAPEGVTAGSILPFYETAATEDIKAGFFARAICLVEGPSESLALPVYCRRLGFDPDEHGLAVIAVGGVGSLAKWYRLFTTYGIPTYVIFDNDTADDANGTRRHDLLATLGVPEEEREGLMGTSELRVTETWAVMGVDFETWLRSYFGDAYDALDEQAKSISPGIAGKPLRARTIAGQLPLKEGTEGRDCLAELVQQLKRHTLQDE